MRKIRKSVKDFSKGLFVAMGIAGLFYSYSQPPTEEDIRAYNQRVLSEIYIRNVDAVAEQLSGKAQFIKENGTAYIVDNTGKHRIIIAKNRRAMLLD